VGTGGRVGLAVGAADPPHARLTASRIAENKIIIRYDFIFLFSWNIKFLQGYPKFFIRLYGTKVLLKIQIAVLASIPCGWGKLFLPVR
jgi:hypothetical protein